MTLELLKVIQQKPEELTTIEALASFFEQVTSEKAYKALFPLNKARNIKDDPHFKAYAETLYLQYEQQLIALVGQIKKINELNPLLELSGAYFSSNWGYSDPKSRLLCTLYRYVPEALYPDFIPVVLDKLAAIDVTDANIAIFLNAIEKSRLYQAQQSILINKLCAAVKQNPELFSAMEDTNDFALIGGALIQAGVEDTLLNARIDRIASPFALIRLAEGPQAALSISPAAQIQPEPVSQEKALELFLAQSGSMGADDLPQHITTAAQYQLVREKLKVSERVSCISSRDFNNKAVFDALSDADLFERYSLVECLAIYGKRSVREQDKAEQMLTALLAYYFPDKFAQLSYDELQEIVRIPNLNNRCIIAMTTAISLLLQQVVQLRDAQSLNKITMLWKGYSTYIRIDILEKLKHILAEGYREDASLVDKFFYVKLEALISTDESDHIKDNNPQRAAIKQQVVDYLSQLPFADLHLVDAAEKECIALEKRLVSSTTALIMIDSISVNGFLLLEETRKTIRVIRNAANEEGDTHSVLVAALQSRQKAIGATSLGLAASQWDAEMSVEATLRKSVAELLFPSDKGKAQALVVYPGERDNHYSPEMITHFEPSYLKSIADLCDLLRCYKNPVDVFKGNLAAKIEALLDDAKNEEIIPLLEIGFALKNTSHFSAFFKLELDQVDNTAVMPWIQDKVNILFETVIAEPTVENWHRFILLYEQAEKEDWRREFKTRVAERLGQLEADPVKLVPYVIGGFLKRLLSSGSNQSALPMPIVLSIKTPLIDVLNLQYMYQAQPNRMGNVLRQNVESIVNGLARFKDRSLPEIMNCYLALQQIEDSEALDSRVGYKNSLAAHLPSFKNMKTSVATYSIADWIAFYAALKAGAYNALSEHRDLVTWFDDYFSESGFFINYLSHQDTVLSSLDYIAVYRALLKQAKNNAMVTRLIPLLDLRLLEFCSQGGGTHKKAILAFAHERKTAIVGAGASSSTSSPSPLDVPAWILIIESNANQTATLAHRRNTVRHLYTVTQAIAVYEESCAALTPARKEIIDTLLNRIAISKGNDMTTIVSSAISAVKNDHQSTHQSVYSYARSNILGWLPVTESRLAKTLEGIAFVNAIKKESLATLSDESEQMKTLIPLIQEIAVAIRQYDKGKKLVVGMENPFKKFYDEKIIALLCKETGNLTDTITFCTQQFKALSLLHSAERQYHGKLRFIGSTNSARVGAIRTGYAGLLAAKDLNALQTSFTTMINTTREDHETNRTFGRSQSRLLECLNQANTSFVAATAKTATAEKRF